MTKYYRVIKDTFLWKEGAILKLNPSQGSEGGYDAIEDVWNAVEGIDNEYISAHIIENAANSEFFQRIYVDSLKSDLFRTAEELKELYKGAFKAKKKK